MYELLLIDNGSSSYPMRNHKALSFNQINTLQICTQCVPFLFSSSTSSNSSSRSNKRLLTADIKKAKAGPKLSACSGILLQKPVKSSMRPISSIFSLLTFALKDDRYFATSSSSTSSIAKSVTRRSLPLLQVN